MADIIIISIAVNSNKYPLIPENIDIMLAEIIGPTIPSIEFITPAQIATDTSVRLKDIDEQIHKISNSPDFSDDAFGTSSGIAMGYKLLGFENTAGAIAANMTKALQKRLELICAILKMVNGDAIWRDINKN